MYQADHLVIKIDQKTQIYEGKYGCYELILKTNGNEFHSAVLPCLVDLQLFLIILIKISSIFESLELKRVLY